MRSELLVIFVNIFLSVTAQNDLFKLSVIHLNDFHTRFDETTPKSTPCRHNEADTCIGGIARVVTEIKRLMKERPNPILLNAGDNYQGTLYFNLFGYQLVTDVMNMIPFHAHTLGNHEFDKKIVGLVPFLRDLIAPVVIANMDDSKHPELHGLYSKSIVVEIAGKKIGVIGVIYPKTNEISNTEGVVFLDESATVNAEADRLQNEEKVFTVIVLSHCGYDLDMEIARRARPNIGLVVGAHSHTLLYRGTPPDDTKALGTYPTVIKRTDGGNVYVVQASCYTKYLGDFTILYNARGQVNGWEGSGLPIYLGHNVAQDPDMLEYLAPYIKNVTEYGSVLIGTTELDLDQSACRDGECTLGNMITDAMLSSDFTEDALVGFINVGGIRTSISAGEILYDDLITAQPFENTFDTGIISGEGLWKCGELMGMPSIGDINLLQVSGLKITLDMGKPPGERVTRLVIRKEPGSDEYEDVVKDDTKSYKIVMVSFLATAGDGFTCFPDYVQNHQQGPVDIDVLEKFIKLKSPLHYELEDRIIVIR